MQHVCFHGNKLEPVAIVKCMELDRTEERKKERRRPRNGLEERCLFDFTPRQLRPVLELQMSVKWVHYNAFTRDCSAPKMAYEV